MVTNCDDEKLEFEAMPEFVREPYSAPKESYTSSYGQTSVPRTQATSQSLPQFTQQPQVPPTISSIQQAIPQPAPYRRKGPSVAERMAEFMAEHHERNTYSAEEGDLPKSAELEALWPGVNHDFYQTSRKSPSFYLTVGFMAGAVVSLIVAWVYSMAFHPSSPTQAQAPQTDAKPIVVAHGAQTSAKLTSAAPQTLTVQGTGSELITPIDSVYEVKDGDTLAGIALHEYKRVSPRLMDAICRANGMANADHLSLGQKLNMPQYRTQPTQISAGSGRIQ
jgi:phage tail protein X